MSDYKEDKLYSRCEYAEMFEYLDSRIQDDLIAWFSAYPDEQEKELLLKLYQDGRFKAWDCPGCGCRVYHGDPESWDEFQGTCNQDFSSYFGNKDKYTEEYLSALCDDCRLKP